jgi:two-component system, cell cycle sensor histidine kinase and response regulator CckA
MNETPPNGFRWELSQHDTLGDKIIAAQTRLDSLAAKGSALPPDEQAMVDELLEAFSITLEELRVVGEEVQQQNEALSVAYAELQTVQQRYRDLFQFAPSGYFVTDLNGVIRQANRAAGLLVGLSPAGLVNKPLVVYIAAGHRADFHRRLNRLLSSNDSVEVEWETELWARSSSEERVPVLLSGALMRDAAQQPTGLLWLARDISKRKATEEALLMAERQALVGRLASSLAHEVGNPLQTVLGCMGLAYEALEGGKLERAGYLMQVGRAELQRAGNILHRLRELSRPPIPDRTEPTDLNALLERVLLVAAKHCDEHNVEVVWHPVEDLRPVEATPDRLQQVFLNLVLNAVDAMPEGGTLTVRAEPAGRMVRATVSDTGVGLDATGIEHIFTPFYTTKAGGMGLGLYVCKQIVDEHKGEIDILNKPGQGATFVVSLPVAST